MTQKEQIVEQLNKFGFVSRNWALRLYITRLGAIMNTLKKEGIEWHGDYEKTQNGLDYLYRLKTSTTAQNEAKKPMSELDSKLKTILYSTKPSWDNQNQIKEIQHALKLGRGYDFKKQIIIKKYEAR
jgi:hypothetical protein